MKKPNLEDFKLKSFKMIGNGGAEIEYSYRYSEGNEAHEDVVHVKKTLSIHQDLNDIRLKQKGNVLMVEAENYRLMPTTAEKMGIDNLEQLSQIAEGMTQDAMMKIDVTGFKISGQEDKRNVVITYKKMTGNKKIAGRATTAIQLSANVYGFEDELEADIDDLVKECYDYVYKHKHSESDQLQFDFFADNVEIDENENNDDPE